MTVRTGTRGRRGAILLMVLASATIGAILLTAVFRASLELVQAFRKRARIEQAELLLDSGQRLIGRSGRLAPRRRTLAGDGWSLTWDPPRGVLIATVSGTTRLRALAPVSR